MNRPYSLNYARLASGAFYETIGLATFYEIIIIFIRRKKRRSAAPKGI
jgi:hypothetical protein